MRHSPSPQSQPSVGHDAGSGLPEAAGGHVPIGVFTVAWGGSRPHVRGYGHRRHRRAIPRRANIAVCCPRPIHGCSWRAYLPILVPPIRPALLGTLTFLADSQCEGLGGSGFIGRCRQITYQTEYDYVMCRVALHSQNRSSTSAYSLPSSRSSDTSYLTGGSSRTTESFLSLSRSSASPSRWDGHFISDADSRERC